MVKSLLELCTIVCQKNVRDIFDVGGAPWSIVSGIIEKVDNPEQLREIQRNSPHLETHTGHIWRRFIERDFRRLDKTHGWQPSNEASWHKIYAKYKKADEQAKKDATDRLVSAMQGIQEGKKSNASKVVDYDRRKLPRTPLDSKAYGGSVRRGPGRFQDQTGGMRFTGGSRTKTNTSKGLLKKAIREAKEITTRNRLNTPTGALAVRPGQIRNAPPSMVQEHINKARPATGVRPPSLHSRSNARDREQEEREERLRSAKRMRTDTKVTYLSDDDLDDDLDDVFGGDRDYDSDDDAASGSNPGFLSEEFLDEPIQPSPPKPSRSTPASASKSGPQPTSGRTGIMSRKPARSAGSSSSYTMRVEIEPPKSQTRHQSNSRSVERNNPPARHSQDQTPSRSLQSRPQSQLSSLGGSEIARSLSPPQQSSSRTAPSTQSKAMSPASSPPPKNSPADAPGGKPLMQRKRKPVDVFMKPKPKVVRR
ncbi:RNA polymerase II transcription factor SIII subunit A-domain-containing protein [Xylariaceae sp. FL0016]|nr:RNA polymerase II transcription factor SIII subunit A-domain-containing protein [Xylariaceae sp. FL0016]